MSHKATTDTTSEPGVLARRRNALADIEESARVEGWFPGWRAAAASVLEEAGSYFAAGKDREAKALRRVAKKLRHGTQMIRAAPSREPTKDDLDKAYGELVECSYEDWETRNVAP